MNAVKWAIGGAIGGLVGAGIWAAVGHYSGSEIGWIAWGVGFLVGLGVRVAAQEDDGYGPGIVATVIAIGAVLLGKYLVISWAVSGISAEFASFQVGDENMIAAISHEIVDQREAAGQQVNLPENVADEAPVSASFPPDIWAAATKQWNEVPPAEKQTRIAERQKEIDEFSETIGGALTEGAFRESFAAWDLLWLALASFTAFKLGSGLESGE